MTSFNCYNQSPNSLINSIMHVLMHSLIVIIWFVLSFSLNPKVITLSSAHCIIISPVEPNFLFNFLKFNFVYVCYFSPRHQQMQRLIEEIAASNLVKANH